MGYSKYILSFLPTSQICEKDIEETVERLNKTVYKYFKYFRLVEPAMEDLRNFTEMYKNFTKQQLKKESKQLKMKEIIFFTNPFHIGMLRAKATSSPTNKVYNIDDDLELKNNFLSYVKHYLEKAIKVLPTFSKTTCCKFSRVF